MNDISGTTAGHNSKVRADLIRSVCREITDLEAERQKITDSISEIKQKKIKGDLGMKIGDFNIALRLYKLEGDDRDQLLDTVHETFEALGVGEQLDWISASQRAAEKPSDPPAAETEKAKEKAAAKKSESVTRGALKKPKNKSGKKK